MKKISVPVILGVIIVAAGLLAMPFILSSEIFTGDHPAKRATETDREIVVFAESSLEPQNFTSLSTALKEMTATIPVGSAIATTPVHGGSVIIARNNEYWRTIPPGVVFFLDEGEAEVFIDHAEFGLYLKKNPELERAGARALRLDEFFRALLNNEPL
jgi:hypothetical protein